MEDSMSDSKIQEVTIEGLQEEERNAPVSTEIK